MGNILENILSIFKTPKVTLPNDLKENAGYLKFYPLDNDFKEDFFLNLRKTISWTESIINRIEDKSKINYGRVLRSVNPIYEGKPFYTYYDLYDYLVATPDLYFNYYSVLADVLKFRNDINLPKENINKLGKILKFEIDVTTYDGAPCGEGGFVDESDIPPIDTWFFITTKYLYCWIPSMFISKMQDAIDVECFGSYNWLEDINPEINKQIIERLEKKAS